MTRVRLAHGTTPLLITFLLAGFTVVGIIPLIMFEKGDVVFWVNSWANETADYFFRCITHLGDGFIWLLALVLALFMRYRYALTAVFGGLLNLLITHLFKRVLFPGTLRPTMYFEPEAFHHLMEGFNYHRFYTFPSGHTITAFTVAFFLSYMFPDRRLQLFFFVCALLAGFSRIYLLQHFYADVYVGAILGFVCFLLAVLITEKGLRLHERPRWNRALRLRRKA